MKRSVGLMLVLFIPLFVGCKVAGFSIQRDEALKPIQEETVAKPINQGVVKTNELVVQEERKVPTVETAPSEPKICGADLQCANELIVKCSLGSYFQEGGTVDSKRLYIVKGRSVDGGCTIEWLYPEANNEYKGLKMSCIIPGDVQTARMLDSYNVSKHFSNCDGNMKDYINRPLSETTGKAISCNDADCANNLLQNCSKGTFSVERIRDEKTTELVFEITDKPTKGICLTNVKITQSPEKKFIGPIMQCVLKEKIKTMYDIQNFINNKFRTDESNSFSTCTGDLYKLVQDAVL